MAKPPFFQDFKNICMKIKEELTAGVNEKDWGWMILYFLFVLLVLGFLTLTVLGAYHAAFPQPSIVATSTNDTNNYDGNYVGSDNTATVTQEMNNYPIAFPKPKVKIDTVSTTTTGLIVHSQFMVTVGIDPQDPTRYALKQNNTSSVQCTWILNPEENTTIIGGPWSELTTYEYDADCYSSSLITDPNSLFEYTSQ